MSRRNAPTYPANSAWAHLNRGPRRREARFQPDSSSLLDHAVDPNAKPTALSSRTLKGIAEFIKTPNVSSTPKKIVVLTGAGISTSAGIPDFRSPKTGLYANLARLNLPTPESVFDLRYFRENPEPFYVLAKELYPGEYYPTITHAFLALLYQKGFLDLLFTQNIDTLEIHAGVPREKIVAAHGSFASQRCIDCQTEFPDEQMKVAVESSVVPRCIKPECSGLVKPDILFFGEQLPASFMASIDAIKTADLLIVMGTSLAVAPFSSLPGMTRKGVPRLLLNNERVADFGQRLDDVVVLADCDSSVTKLAEALGWEEELRELWTSVGPEGVGREGHQGVEEEIERIATEMNTVLSISNAPAKVSGTHFQDLHSGSSTSTPLRPLPDPTPISAASTSSQPPRLPANTKNTSPTIDTKTASPRVVAGQPVIQEPLETGLSATPYKKMNSKSWKSNRSKDKKCSAM